MAVTAQTGGSEQDKIIVVVGRAPDFDGFIGLVSAHLFDNYDLITAQALEEDHGIDGKIRFVGFVSGTPTVEGFSINDQARRLNQTGGELGATVYNDADEAMAAARDKFGFQDADLNVEQRQARRELLKEKYPNLASDEIAFYNVFESLVTTGKVNLMRGILDDDTPVSCIVFGVSDDQNQMTIQAMALMIDRPEIRARLSFPFDEMEG